MNIEPSKARPLISPRLIGLISTINEDGSVNASPYSWVFPFSYAPLLIGVGAGSAKIKNTQRNAEREKEFVVNIVSEDFAEKAIKLEGIHGSNQLEEAGLNAIESKKVKTKSIAEAKIRFECKLSEVLKVKNGDHVFLVGEVVNAYCEKLDGELPDLDSLGILMHVGGSEFRKVGEKVLIERKK